MRRRSPKLLYEVLKSKNVVCTPNYNVINSYLPFSFFSFFYVNVIAITRCNTWNVSKSIAVMTWILFFQSLTSRSLQFVFVIPLLSHGRSLSTGILSS